MIELGTLDLIALGVMGWLIFFGGILLVATSRVEEAGSIIGGGVLALLGLALGLLVFLP